MPVIDVHTHMLNKQWLDLLRRDGKPRYAVRKRRDAAEGIFLDGALHDAAGGKGCVAPVGALAAIMRGGNAQRAVRL